MPEAVGETSPTLSSKKQNTWTWTAFLSLGLGLFFLVWRGPMPLEGVLRALAAKDAWHEGVAHAARPAVLRHYYALGLAGLFLFLGLLPLASAAWARLDEKVRGYLYEAAFTLAISCTMLLLLSSLEYDSPWLPLDRLMNDPSSVPIFGHRVFFLWVAKGFQKVVPGLSNLRAFYLSQWIASVLALIAVRRWSAYYIDRSLGWAGQILAMVLMCTCFDYYIFYDIGTVFFTTCALIAIYSRRYWLLVPVVLFGTLNYEGTLLLLPLTAFVAYREPWKKWLPSLGVSFVAYCLVRFALQKFLPVPGHFEWRVWSNLAFPYVYPRQLASVLFKGGLWLLLGLMSFRYCSPRLKRLALLFPLNFATSFLFGKLNEVRLFEACIPVLVAMVLSASVQRYNSGGRAAVLDAAIDRA